MAYMSFYRPSTVIAFLAVSLAQAAEGQTPPGAVRYPATARGSQTDDYHGSRIADPYRWLENTDSPETAAWVQAQNAVTFSYLAGIPARAAIRNRLMQVWNYPKYSSPSRAGNRLFYYENSGLLSQSILYVKDDGRPARVLLDPNSMSADGTVALSTSQESPDGRYLGYGVSASGSDWQEFRVRNVDTGRDLTDTLKWVKFSGLSWTKDNKGFFYSRYDSPKNGNTLTNVNQNQKLYYHRLGAPQSADRLVYDRPDQPGWLFDATVTDDGTFAVITVSAGSDRRTRLYYVFLDNAKKPKVDAPVVRLIDQLDAEYAFVHNTGDNFLVRTDFGAPKGRLVSIDINAAQSTRWLTVIPEGKDAMGNVQVIGNRLVVSYLQDAHSSIRVYGMPDADDLRRGRGTRQGAFPGGSSRGAQRPPAPEEAVVRDDRASRSAPGYPYIGEIALPGIGSVSGITGRPKDDEMFYSFTSYLSPPSVFRYDLKRRVNTVYKTASLPMDLNQFETKQVFFKSKDGTQVPIFITSKKGLTLNGANPTILYGYGGFNISQTPAFSPANLVWLEMGGVYAVANLRGGGEYGKDWHEAGTLGRKQNVFDDFIGAAQYLVNERYTSPAKLAVAGGSNGGLLVGAVVNQRPELFGAALPAVGVMDMLRFHKFTIGAAWTSDYGSADNPADFAFLRAYSPLHNIKPGVRYPATMVLTADHDDRVVPGHSFKYAATLQNSQAGPAPILIRIDTKAGHGAGKPTAKRIDEAADRFAFLVQNLNMRVTLQ
ncbi:MAG: prolyl oligopeptidase family serine peptidase [Gemmatimonadaceae bacterium]